MVLLYQLLDALEALGIRARRIVKRHYLPPLGVLAPVGLIKDDGRSSNCLEPTQVEAESLPAHKHDRSALLLHAGPHVVDPGGGVVPPPTTYDCATRAGGSYDETTM